MPPRGVAYSFSRGLYDATTGGQFRVNPTIAPGDFTISKDNGAFVNLTNLPVVSPPGSVLVLFRLTADEMTADHIAVLGIDQAGGEWTQFLENITTTDVGPPGGPMAPLTSGPLAPVDLPRVQILDNAGVPISGALIYTYAGGTTTPLATYQNALGTAYNTNPIMTDSGGFCDIWLPVGVAYKLQVRTPLIPGPSQDLYPAVDNVALNPQATLQSMAGFSADAGQGNMVIDPGEPGAEVLATSAAEEIQQLRFRIQEMALTTNWRTSRRTKKVIVPMSSGGAADGQILVHGLLSKISGIWLVTDDYAGGDVTFSFLHEAASAVGVLAVYHSIFKFRETFAVTPLVNHVIASFTPVDIYSHVTSRVIAASDVTIGDGLQFDVIRDGLDPGETNTQRWDIAFFFVQYTTFAGA
jgi:hypothetical protein